MISLELLDEFNNTVNSGQCISQELLKKIIINEVENSDTITKNSFNDIVFESLPESNALGSFEADDGLIIIDHDKMQHKYDKSIKECKEDIFIYNIGFIQALLHEFEHLKEISKSKNNNIESLIIRLSSMDIIFDFYDNKYSKLDSVLGTDVTELIIDRLGFSKYKSLYNITPNERLADIYSYKTIFESFSRFPDFDKDLLKLLYNVLIFEYHNGYKISKDSYSPTITYLNKLKKLLNYKSNEFNSLILKFYMLYNSLEESLTLEEKMRYGLQVPFNERKEIRKVLTINNKDFML